MTWQEALETPSVRAHPAYQRYRVLCAEEFPEPNIRDGYRQIVIRLADPHGPSALTQLVTAAAALGRAAGQALTGGPLTVSQTEYDRRLTICQNCPEFIACGPRCRKCGCFLQVKARLESETGQCPIGQW